MNISQPTATVAAAAACDGCHLMTEAEWMTIAADVLTIKYNWSGGKVGSGFIYAGHNDGAPGAALEASDRDDDGYANTGNSGSSGPRQKRTLYLKSGDVIWDIAGNIYEWTEGVVSGSQPGVPADSSDAATYSWKQWGDSGMSWGSFPNISRPSQMATIPGLSDINTWDTSNGIGRLNSNRNQSAVRGYLRGGYWDNSTSAGVLTLALSRAPATELPYVGFRAAR